MSVRTNRFDLKVTPVDPVHVFGKLTAAPAATGTVVLASLDCQKGQEALTHWLIYAQDNMGAAVNASYVTGITFTLLAVQGVANPANTDLQKGRPVPWETGGPNAQFVNPAGLAVFRNVGCPPDTRLVFVVNWDIATAPAGLKLAGNAFGFKWSEDSLSLGQKLQLMNTGIG
jgi:hypothetical protein